jgi:hypothetical protein
MEMDARPSAFETIVYGGLAIGVLDFFDATLFFGLYGGLPFERLWQGVAAGLLGSDSARAGGWNTAILGMFLHFTVALSIATVYFGIVRLIPILLQHPIISGLVYGIAAHLVMKYIVVPLSAIGLVAPYTLSNFLNSMIGHAVLVGLPVALIASWSAKRRSPRVAA